MPSLPVERSKSSRQDVRDGDAPDLDVVEQDRDLLAGPVDFTDSVSDRLGRAARPGVNFYLAVDEIHDPVSDDPTSPIDSYHQITVVEEARVCNFDKKSHVGWLGMTTQI